MIKNTLTNLLFLLIFLVSTSLAMPPPYDIDPTYGIAGESLKLFIGIYDNITPRSNNVQLSFEPEGISVHSIESAVDINFVLIADITIEDWALLGCYDILLYVDGYRVPLEEVYDCFQVKYSPENCSSKNNPCPDDGLYCNGKEFCNETNDRCQHSGNPCQEGTQCSKVDDECLVQPPPETTTTTSIPTTSSIASTSSSTTTTAGLCSSEQIYGDNSEETELLRRFRDNVLNQTQEGREIIRLYYQWSPVIVKAMEADEEFKKGVEEMIDGVLEMI